MTDSRRMVVAVDDGFNLTKCYCGNGRKTVVKSRVKVGAADSISLGDGEKKVFEYQTDGMEYTAGDVQGVPTMSDEYPTSPQNRVVVHHAMHRAGLSGQRVELVTSLPIRLFYRKGERNPKNEDLISSKKQNLAVAVRSMDLPAIEVGGTQEVMPEAVSVFFDYAIQETDDGPVRDKARGEHAIGVIDIGGRTTDFATISDKRLDFSRSGSANLGILKIHEELKEAIISKHDLEDLSDSVVDRAMQSGRVKLRNREFDVSPIIDQLKGQLASSIRAHANRYFGSGAELDRILLIGGGSVALASFIEGWYSGDQLLAVEDPVFANARGMYKYQRYVI